MTMTTQIIYFDEKERRQKVREATPLEEMALAASPARQLPGPVTVSQIRALGAALGLTDAQLDTLLTSAAGT